MPPDRRGGPPTSSRIPILATQQPDTIHRFSDFLKPTMPIGRIESSSFFLPVYPGALRVPDKWVIALWREKGDTQFRMPAADAKRPCAEREGVSDNRIRHRCDTAGG